MLAAATFEYSSGGPPPTNSGHLLDVNTGTILGPADNTGSVEWSQPVWSGNLLLPASFTGGLRAHVPATSG